MPILKENKHLYPANWKELSDKAVIRAGYKCQQCGVENYALGGRHKGEFYYAIPKGEKMLSLEWPKPGEMWWCSGLDVQLRIIRIILTVAHMDHDPANCKAENLKALCQRCHLRYDQQHHAQTRRKRKAMGDLFDNA